MLMFTPQQIFINMRVRTEIDDIREATKNYRYPPNEKEFKKAEAYLIKVHKKYGTIDINLIIELIK